jgi:hypothetical protein
VICVLTSRAYRGESQSGIALASGDAVLGCESILRGYGVAATPALSSTALRSSDPRFAPEPATASGNRDLGVFLVSRILQIAMRTCPRGRARRSVAGRRYACKCLREDSFVCLLDPPLDLDPMRREMPCPARGAPVHPARHARRAASQAGPSDCPARGLGAGESWVGDFVARFHGAAPGGIDGMSRHPCRPLSDQVNLMPHQQRAHRFPQWGST